jgi:hypothetical protein
MSSRVPERQSGKLAELQRVLMRQSQQAPQRAPPEQQRWEPSIEAAKQSRRAHEGPRRQKGRAQAHEGPCAELAVVERPRASSTGAAVRWTEQLSRAAERRTDRSAKMAERMKLRAACAEVAVVERPRGVRTRAAARAGSA